MQVKLKGYERAVVTWVDDEGYPVSVPTSFQAGDEKISLGRTTPVPPAGAVTGLTFSHIRPRPGVGYDERRYVSLRGTVDKGSFTPSGSFSWDEKEVPFFQYSELGVPRARRFFERAGRSARPRLSFGWLALRATRLPFLTATVVPVALGVAVAATHGRVHWGYAGLTLLGACLIHLGLNVANDVFDATSGADEANTTPTPYSGGSRVIQYGLVSFRTMASMAAAFYAGGLGIGLAMAVALQSWTLVWIGVAGLFVSLAYTAPPLRLVHRGLGELAVAAGFGPLVVLGSYVVQQDRLSFEALYASIPVALLIALVLYVNEIPDRTGDAKAGKRTLPVRWPQERVLAVYSAVVASTYGLVAAGVAFSVLPVTAVAALATIPIALSVRRGLAENYDDPYALMPVMASGIKLHLFTGLLLVAGYAAAAALGL